MSAIRRALACVLVAAAGLLPACASGFKVETDYDRSADFSAVTTYAWGEMPRPEPEVEGKSPLVNDLLLRRIRAAIDERLAGMGMRQVENQGDASALVTFHVKVTEKLRVPNDPYYAFYQVESYEEGTLVIDFMDRERHVLLWRGVAESRVQNLRTPEAREARIREAVAAILDRYPN